MTTKIKLKQVYPIPASASNSELTGTPTAPTPSTSDDSNKIATTEYVKDNLSNYLPLSGGELLGNLYINDNNNLGIYTSNVDLSQTFTSAKENWKIILKRNPEDTTHSGDYLQIGAIQPANSKNLQVGFRVGNPRGGNLPTSGTNVATGNTWTGLAMNYNYDLNKSWPMIWGNNLDTPAINDSSTKLISTSYLKSIVPISVGDANTPVYTDSNGVITSTGKSFANYLPLSGGTLTGSLTFANGVWNTVGDDVKIGDFNKAGLLGVMGANGTSGIAICKKDDAATYKAITYDGTTFSLGGYTLLSSVPANAKFTDTVTTATTSGSGNAVTAITASDGALTVTKGSTFSLSNHSHGGTSATFATAKGTAPSSNQYHEAISYDNTGKGTGTAYRFALVGRSLNTSNLSSAYLVAYDATSASTKSATLGVYYPANGTPYTAAPTPAQTDDSTKIATTAYVKDCVPKSIGSATQPVYTNANGVVTACTNKSLATALCNSLDTGTSNPADADYYICQYANGGTTTTSYHRRPTSALYNYIKGKTDTLYVALSGAQTVAGNKTFSGTSTFSGQVILTKNTDGAGTAANAVPLIVGGAQTAKHLELDSDELMAKSNGTTASALYINTDGGAVYIGNAGKGVCVNSSNSIYPRTTKAISCGHSSYLWTTVYAQTATISTSDERQKQQIQDIPDEVLDAWEEVEFKQYKLNDSVAEKGDEKARIHIGLIAQNIMEVFEKHGLDPTKYGLFCHDEWDVHEDPEDETSPIIRHEDSYALRYEEALCLEAACDRRFRKRVMALLNKQSN